MKQVFRSIYSAIPFKKELFTVLRKFRPSESSYKHLYFKGPFRVPVDKSYFNIHHNGYQLENDLFWRGLDHWESSSLKLWAQLATQSKLILDIGANTGVYSLIAGAVNKSSVIYAFEPLEEVFRQLNHNISLNRFNIKAFQIAASNKNGSTLFYADGDFSYAGSLNQNHFVEKSKTVEVRCQTLDSFITDNSIFPDLVKIDVERHEPEVIEGFLGHIKRFLPTMLIEVLDEPIGEKIRILLQDTSYLYFSVNDKTKEIKQMKQMGKSEDFNVLVITEKMAQKVGLIKE